MGKKRFRIGFSGKFSCFLLFSVFDGALISMLFIRRFLFDVFYSMFSISHFLFDVFNSMISIQ